MLLQIDYLALKNCFRAKSAICQKLSLVVVLVVVVVVITGNLDV